MPAEWERHECTWLSWPKNLATFTPKILGEVESTYVQIIEALTKGEKVNILVDNETEKLRVTKILSKINEENVLLREIKSADVWVRDYGPIFVSKEGPQGVAATKWVFNAWGNKYDDLLYDNYTGGEIAASTGFRLFETESVLEGGSVDVNGLGTCITTKQCLLNRNRNPQLDRQQIEEKLRRFLGVRNLIWLDSGIKGDDTDGHVDDTARFVDGKTVLCMVEDDQKDPNYETLKSNFAFLEASRDQDGNDLRIVPVKMPKAIESGGERLPATYANFYIGNSAVLVPTFGAPSDESALDTIESFFPTRKVVGINCIPLINGFGAIHCVTQQQPASNVET